MFCPCPVPAEQASNRLICIQNHIFLAALLNRTLLISLGIRDTSRQRYNWSLILSTPHLQACYGRAAVRAAPTAEYGSGTPRASAFGASSQNSAGQPRGVELPQGNSGGVPVVHQVLRRRLGMGSPRRAGPLRVGAVLCWSNRMVGDRSLCSVPWKLLRGEFIPPLSSTNVEGMDLGSLLGFHREKLEAVPAIMVLDLFYAGPLLYGAKEPAFVDLPIARKKACSGSPAMLPHSDIVTAAREFVRGAPRLQPNSDIVTDSRGLALQEGLGNRPFLALHLRRKDFLTTCARGWVSACISLREVRGVAPQGGECVGLR